jgi:hypothetical protein
MSIKWQVLALLLIDKNLLFRARLYLALRG